MGKSARRKRNILDEVVGELPAKPARYVSEIADKQFVLWFPILLAIALGFLYLFVATPIEPR